MCRAGILEPVQPGPPLRDVACFALVARHLNFSRAAAELDLSQPAMSQAIGRLERALGVRLFERTSREVQLTPTGKALLPYADDLLAAAHALTGEAARLALPPRPVIRLAYPPVVGTFAARVARRLAHRRPAIDVELWPAGWRAATEALARGEVLAAILSPPFPPEVTTTGRFHVAVEHLAVPASDPLASRPGIRLDQLDQHGVLLPRHRPPGGMWARLAARLAGPHQQRVVTDEIDDFAAALDLVAAGAGVLPVPRPLAETIRRGDVRFVPFNGSDLRLTYGLAWSPKHASNELIALVQAVHLMLRTR
jgi:DNA-binding transcriptional LysR family regulator